MSVFTNFFSLWRIRFHRNDPINLLPWGGKLGCLHAGSCVSRRLEYFKMCYMYFYERKSFQYGTHISPLTSILHFQYLPDPLKRKNLPAFSQDETVRITWLYGERLRLGLFFKYTAKISSYLNSPLTEVPNTVQPEKLCHKLGGFSVFSCLCLVYISLAYIWVLHCWLPIQLYRVCSFIRICFPSSTNFSLYSSVFFILLDSCV